jgi:hypothetical protein
MKELLAQYADGYLLLKEAVKGLSEEELNFKPAPEAWSIKEIVVHVADTEIVAIHRMKRVISEENPLLTAFDQNAWAKRQQYMNLDANLYVELLGLLRQSFLPVLNSLTAEDWQHTGIHIEAGKVALHDLLKKFVGHLDTHLRQIDRLKQAYRNK